MATTAAASTKVLTSASDITREDDIVLLSSRRPRHQPISINNKPIQQLSSAEQNYLMAELFQHEVLDTKKSTRAATVGGTFAAMVLLMAPAIVVTAPLLVAVPWVAGVVATTTTTGMIAAAWRGGGGTTDINDANTELP